LRFVICSVQQHPSSESCLIIVSCVSRLVFWVVFSATDFLVDPQCCKQQLF
jgi:hypothetical protein